MKIHNEFRKMQKILRFNFNDDAIDLYSVKDICIYDNAEMKGVDIAKKLKELLPSMSENLIYFHDEIGHIRENCIFVVAPNVIDATRIANRTTLHMIHINQLNEKILMVFEKNSKPTKKISSEK